MHWKDCIDPDRGPHRGTIRWPRAPGLRAAFPEMPNDNLLIVGNFQPDVGYAWNTILEYFLALGRMFRERGARTIVCFPGLGEVPDRLMGDCLGVIEFDFWSRGRRDLQRLVRENSIGYVYLTDRPVYSPRYLVCRMAGVKRIVIHDRTSGERDTPSSIKKFGKVIVSRTPLAADLVLAISDYVRERQVRVSCIPAGRVVRIWNGVDIGRFCPGGDEYVRTTFGIREEAKIVLSHSRAIGYKGIEILIRAAGMLVNGEGRNGLIFLHCGDGPDLERFRDIVREEGLEGRFLLPGKVDSIDRIIKGATAVVVPSLWQEGFGLSVIEGMAAGKPVVASRVGGIVEIIDDGRDGYLVPPGDPGALSVALGRILDDEQEAGRVGAFARRTVVERFNIEDKKLELTEVFRSLLANRR